MHKTTIDFFLFTGIFLHIVKPALSRREDAGFIGKHQTKNLPTRGGCKPSVGRMLTSSES